VFHGVYFLVILILALLLVWWSVGGGVVAGCWFVVVDDRGDVVPAGGGAFFDCSLLLCLFRCDLDVKFLAGGFVEDDFDFVDGHGFDFCFGFAGEDFDVLFHESEDEVGGAVVAGYL